MTFSTGKATTKNVTWAYASFFSTKVLNLIAVIIVARYLQPAEFGTMALCLAIMGYFSIVSRFGLSAALISAVDRLEETANAVFYTALLISGTMALALWSVSGLLADHFGTPLLEPLLGLLSLALVVKAISVVNAGFLSKELRFKQKLIPDIIRGLTKGFVSIALAYMGYGVWALVFGYLASAIAGSIALMIIRPWRPGPLPDKATVKSVLRFGVHLIGAETINSTPRLLDNLLIGGAFGPAVLGIYALAFRIPEMGIKSFTTVAGTVLHPIMSKIQDDSVELKLYFYQALRYCSVLMFGVGAMIAVLSEPIVHVLYPPRWYDMIVPMQFIAIAFAISTLNMIAGNFLKAVNRTNMLFQVSLINLPMFVIVLYLAVPYGITVVALAQILMAVLSLVPTYIGMRKVMDLNTGDTLAALWPAFVCAGAGAVAAYGTLYVFDGPDLARLILATLAYLLSFLGVMYFAMPELFAAGSKIIARKLGTT